MNDFHEDPTLWSIWTWVLALSMSCAGGVVNWLSPTGRPGIIALFAEVFISGFVGCAAFMVALSLDQTIGIAAAISGIVGHMATRLLFLVEAAIERKLKKL